MTFSVMNGEEMEDYALEDPEDPKQYLTHSSGDFGAFSKQDHLEMVRLFLADIEKHDKNAVAVKNMFYIYQFVHVDRQHTGSEEVTQITVGLVKKIHHCDVAHESSKPCCPPKGAKLASKG